MLGEWRRINVLPRSARLEPAHFRRTFGAPGATVMRGSFCTHACRAESAQREFPKRGLTRELVFWCGKRNRGVYSIEIFRNTLWLSPRTFPFLSLFRASIDKRV